MHSGNVVRAGGQPGADGPYRLISDDKTIRPSPIRNRSGELSRNHFNRRSRLTLLTGFADAEDRDQPRSPCARNLVANGPIGFAMILPPLGVAQNDVRATEIRQHFRADVAGGGAFCKGVAILPAERYAAPSERSPNLAQQSRRRADEQVAGQLAPGGSPMREGARQCRAVFAQPVHFPIAGDQPRPNRHVATPLPRDYHPGYTITPALGQVNRAGKQRPPASMLQAIRSRAGSFIVKALFALLILTFAVWGIGDIFRTQPVDTVVATVGDHNIRAEELQTAVRRALEQLSMRFGSAIDLQQAKQLGLVDQTLTQLVDRSLVDQEAARLRLDISDDLIRNVITGNPNFRGADGRFDRALFNAVLAANRLTEEQYVALLRHDIPRNDLIQAVTAGAVISQPTVDLLYRHRNEKRTAEIVSLPVAAVTDVGQPGEAELQSFYDAHKDLFRAPEYRSFTLTSLSPGDVSKDIEIPEAKLKEEYDQRQDELQLPERREVEQILAPSEEKAKEAEQALVDGKEWREVATTVAGQDPDTIDLGLLKREEMPTALGNAAFELPAEKPSEPIKTPLGWHILRVVKIEPPVTQSFEQAKPKLEADLIHQEAVDRIYKVANKVDDALAGGASINDVAAKFSLKTTTVPAVDVSGQDPQGKPVELPAASSEVVKLAFATSEGQTSRVTETLDGAIFALRTDKITLSEVKPLDEVRQKAVDLWQADQRRERVAKEAGELAAAVQPGNKLANVAAERGLKATTSAPFTRHPDQGNSMPQALVPKLFSAKPGETVTASDPTGSFVAQLEEVSRPENVSQTATAELSRELDAEQRADIVEEFTRALRSRFPVVIHHEVVDRLF
jgi:peptidyl-prolyl cis-trans isomerase D